ncbi:YadA-like family protein [Fusobacterium watanabei]|uniref:YadA-like family protein n=1 Tax=Fusobacterium watanabei TaxID=2686067 RepID=UPI003B588DF5
MKKSISLKLIVFSFLLVVSNLTYSTPVFQAGTGTNSTVAGVNNIATGDRSSAVGYLNTTSEENSSAMGYNNTASGKDSSAIGNLNSANKDNSSAVGFFNTADGKDSLAMGYHNETKKVSSTAVGVENKANAENSSAIGYNNKANAENSLAVGVNNKASEDFSSAIGFSNTVSGNSSSTFGVENIVTGNYSTAVGYKNKVSDNGSYAFGNDNTINGDNNFVLGNNVNIGAGIQNSVALGNNSTVSSSNEVSVGSKGKERKITNVADGEVSATSTDAVTGKQLYKAMQNSGAASIENLKSEVYEKIDNVKDEVRGVGSLSAALAGLHPMQYDPKAPAQVMAALGHYKNKQAIAVGASYYFNDRFMMSTGIALSGEKKTKTMANVGFTLKLGKGSGVSYNETPLYTIQDEVKRLTLENNKQAKENQELKAKVELQGVENQELKERVKNLEEKLNKLLKNK